MVSDRNQPSSINSKEEEHVPYKHLFMTADKLLLDPKFKLSQHCLNAYIIVPDEMIKLASQTSVFPVRRSVQDVLTKYRQEVSHGRRRPYSFCKRDHMVSLIDAFEEQCKESLQFYLLPCEMEKYFIILNSKRRNRRLSKAVMNDHENLIKFKLKTAKVSKTPVQSLLKSSIINVAIPMNDSFDQIALIRFIYSFMHIIHNNLAIYQFYRPLFNDLLKYMKDTLPNQLYESKK